MLALLLLLTAGLGLWLWYFAHHSRPPNFPRGPPRLPIFGALLQLGTPPHLGLRCFAKEYGPIYGLYCGNYPAIVLSDLKLIKDAFKDDRFSARPPLRPFLERSWGHRKGLIFGSGAEWAEQRKFALSAFKTLGLTNGGTGGVLEGEVGHLVARLRDKALEGVPTPLNQLFHVAIVNTLWHLVAGFRYEYDDPKLKRLIEYTGQVVRFRSLDSSSFWPSVLFFMPWLTRFAPAVSGWDTFLSSFSSIFPTLQEYIDEHKRGRRRQGDSHGGARGAGDGDLIDLYLEKIEDTSDEGSSFFADKGERSLLIVLLDLFVAGGETASSNLTWGFLFLASYPEAQRKVHEELDAVVGDRTPSLADRPRMPYVEAFINEVLRMVTIGAMSIFHSTSEHVPDFHGYTLPKDTIVFGNFWQVHHDPAIWGDPQIFRPERFLEKGDGAKGKSKPQENLRVFSTGKRICPGEGFARDELFMFTVGLLKVFRFDLVPGAPPPCLDPILAATHRSHETQVLIRLRESPSFYS